MTDQGSAPPGPGRPTPTVSPDGFKYWDGDSWVQLPGPICRWDGYQWKVKPAGGVSEWNGTDWIPQPRTGESRWDGQTWQARPAGVSCEWDGKQWVTQPAELPNSRWNGSSWLARPEPYEDHEWDGQSWSARPSDGEYVWNGHRWRKTLSSRGKRRLRLASLGFVGCVVLLALAAAGVAAWNAYSQVQEEQRAAEAAAQAQAAQFQALKDSCDPEAAILSQDPALRDVEVWRTWASCSSAETRILVASRAPQFIDLPADVEQALAQDPDPEVVLFFASSPDSDPSVLASLAGSTTDQSVARALSDNPASTEPVHQQLVMKWGPELTPLSYKTLYKQSGSTVLRQEDYVGEQTFEGGNAVTSARFQLLPDCTIEVESDTGGHLRSNQPWQQDLTGVKIGYLDYSYANGVLANGAYSYRRVTP